MWVSARPLVMFSKPPLRSKFVYLMSGCAGNGCGSCSDKKAVADISTDLGEDVWADENDNSAQTSSTAALHRNHTKQGYLDGLAHAQESSLQDGFDESFPKGAELGRLVGNVLATLCAKEGDKDGSKGLESSGSLFAQAKAELNISKVLQRDHFDDDLKLSGLPEPLQKWQKAAGKE